MKVVPIKRNVTPGRLGAPGAEVVPQWMTFILGAMLTLVMPSILYCAVIGQLWPLCVMACNEALGAALGLLLFKRSNGRFASCVPETCLPRVKSAGGMKMAA